MEKVLESIDKSGVKEVVLILEVFKHFEHEEEKILEDIDESLHHLKQFV